MVGKLHQCSLRGEARCCKFVVDVNSSFIVDCVDCVYVFRNQRICVDERFQLYSEGAFFPFPDCYFAMPPNIGMGVVDNHSER